MKNDTDKQSFGESGTQTSITFPDGYTLYTPLVIESGSSARIACPIILYKAI